MEPSARPAECIASAFSDQVRRTPALAAVVQGDDRLSYAELHRRSDQIARALIQLGIRPEQPVGVHAGRSISMVVAVLGVLKAAACYIPIDPSLPAARKRFIVADTGLRAMLCEAEPPPDDGVRAVCADFDVAIHRVDRLLAADSSAPRSVQFPAACADQLCYVMYTSGSTGQPKGVMTSHGSVLNLAQHGAYVPLDQNDRLLLTGAIGFDATTFEIWGALLNGLTLYLVEQETLSDARLLRAVLQRHEITTVFVTTALCHRLAVQDAALFRTLKYLLIGGDVLSPQTCHAIRQACPGVRVLNVYGPTENTTFSTTFNVDDHWALPIPIGKPLRNTSAYIVDDADRLIEDGRVGELLLGGKNLARGYLNRPELTRERFVELDGLGRVYRTGDLARWQPDGNLEFVGRKDRQIKIAGYRVELGEIDAAIVSIPGILDCASKVWVNQGEKFIAAYFVTRDDTLGPAAVRQILSRTLPDYMVPAFACRMNALPLDAHGKVDQNALADPFAASESIHRPLQEHNDRGPLEALVKDTWQKALGRDDIDVDDDFHDLGGNSIKAVHLMGMMTAYGLKVSLADILHFRTIRALSEYLHRPPLSNDLLHSEGQVVADLHAAFPGIHFSFSRFNATQPDGAAQDVVVLHSDRPVPQDQVLARLASRVSPYWRPHYLLAGFSAPALQPGPISAAQLAQSLGLRSPKDLDCAQIAARLRDEHSRNVMRLRQGKLLGTCPLSAIQELQFGFKTPHSIGYFLIDGHVDPGLFTQAFAQFVQEQSLLRSVPVRSDGRYRWHEFAARGEHAIEPSFLDLSGHFVPDRQLVEFLTGLAQTLSFEGPSLLYQVIVVKRNAREHVVLLVFHHILFDRVSSEVIERELMARYRDLAAGKTLVPRGGASFGDYVQQLRLGPQHLSRQDLVRQFQLTDFFASKRQLLASPRLQTMNCSHSFQIALPSARHLERGRSLGSALASYVKMIATVFAVKSVPVLFIHDGRKYDGKSYYHLVGELIDYVPLVLDATMAPEAMQRAADARLATLDRCNVNFLSLITDADVVQDWPEVRQLVDPGESYARLDVCMFNYMGNRPEPGSYTAHYDPAVQVTPHPLPIHSFLNCIAVSYDDGLILNLRSSYDPRVDLLRQACFDLASEMSA